VAISTINSRGLLVRFNFLETLQLAELLNLTLDFFIAFLIAEINHFVGNASFMNVCADLKLTSKSYFSF